MVDRAALFSFPLTSREDGESEGHHLARTLEAFAQHAKSLARDPDPELAKEITSTVRAMLVRLKELQSPWGHEVDPKPSLVALFTVLRDVNRYNTAEGAADSVRRYILLYFGDAKAIEAEPKLLELTARRGDTISARQKDLIVHLLVICGFARRTYAAYEDAERRLIDAAGIDRHSTHRA